MPNKNYDVLLSFIDLLFLLEYLTHILSCLFQGSFPVLQVKIQTDFTCIIQHRLSVSKETLMAVLFNSLINVETEGQKDEGISLNQRGN